MRTLSTFYLGAIYFLLYLPIAVLVLFSFNNAHFSGLWHGFTFKWYHELVFDRDLQTIALHSFAVSISASTVATIIGTLASFALFKYRFFGKQLIHGIVFIMIVVPDLVMGVSFLMLFHFAHLELGFLTLFLAHVTFCIPFVIVTLLSRLHGANKYLFEAALDLGANDFTIFYKIIIPLVLPGIIAGWLLSFTLSFDDVIISSFVTGPTFQVLPLYIYSQVKLGVTPEINALCTVILLLTVGLASISHKVLRKRDV